MLTKTLMAAALATSTLGFGVAGAQACSSYGSSNCGLAAWEEDRHFYTAPDDTWYGYGYEYDVEPDYESET
jgi:hypothetical protein